MNLNDRINLANADARQEHKRRRIEYWEDAANYCRCGHSENIHYGSFCDDTSCTCSIFRGRQQRKIGSRRDSYMDLKWVWLGLGAAILGAILAVRVRL